MGQIPHTRRREADCQQAGFGVKLKCATTRAFMPFRLLDLDGVANYLHLTPADIEERVKNREIPFEKRGDRIVFRKAEIDAWASQRILGLAGRKAGRLSPGNHAFYAENPAAGNHPAGNAPVGSRRLSHDVQDQGVRPARSGGACGKNREPLRFKNPAGQPGGARGIVFHGGAGRIGAAAPAVP